MPATPGRTATICAYEARSTEAPATGERELQVLIAAWQETHAGFWKLMRPAVRPKIAPGKQRKKPSESANGSAKRKRFRERQSTISCNGCARRKATSNGNGWRHRQASRCWPSRHRRRVRGRRSLRCSCGRSTRCPSSGAESRGGARMNVAPGRRIVLGSILTAGACLSVPLVGRRQRIGGRPCSGGHRAPPAGLRRIHRGLGGRASRVYMIAQTWRRARRPSYGSSASLRPSKRRHSAPCSDQAGDKGFGDRLRQARRGLRPWRRTRCGLGSR